MKIVWDEWKRHANLSKHGLDFAALPDFDWATAVVEESRPGRYQPRRFRAVGWHDGKVAVVIFSALGTEAMSVVSFRWANARERSRFRWSSV